VAGGEEEAIVHCLFQ